MSPRSQASVALITGAGRGLGRLLATGLAAEGVSVGLVGRDRARLEECAKVCADHGVQVAIAVADVRSPEATTRAIDEVREALGPIDLLVNNAGLVDLGEHPFWESSPEHWWEVFETNFRGSVNACHAVMPEMVRRHAGRIVNVNSIFAVRGDIRYSAYSASKAALLALSGTIAEPCAEQGVGLFDVSPGVARTDMTASMAICADRKEWTAPEYIVQAVTRIARGELDQLAGRFLHVGVDDLDVLSATANLTSRSPARRLELRPYGTDDPLA